MESVCFATRMRLDLPERLPSLSEYLCGDDFPSPQLREDDDGNLMVHLERDYASPGDCFLSEYGSRVESPGNIYEEQREDTGIRTWTFLDSKPASNPAPTNNCFRSGPEVVGSYDFSNVDSFPWERFPGQQQQQQVTCYPTSSSTSLLPRFPCADDVTSSSSLIGRDVTLTWSSERPEVTERMSSPTSSTTSSSRKRGHPSSLDAAGGGLPTDPEARKLELKRAKNREAAQRCQQRKQERVVRLEGKVSRLREQNVALNHTVTGLRDQVAWLRRQIAGHANNGCHIALPPFNAV